MMTTSLSDKALLGLATVFNAVGKPFRAAFNVAPASTFLFLLSASCSLAVVGLAAFVGTVALSTPIVAGLMLTAVFTGFGAVVDVAPKIKSTFKRADDLYKQSQRPSN